MFSTNSLIVFIKEIIDLLVSTRIASLLVSISKALIRRALVFFLVYR
jgi:hypothetical protein